MTTIRKIAPDRIEAESFRIITRELGETRFSDLQFPVVRRIIHATGDFDFARIIRFSPGAVEAGISAISSGKNILVDVTMAAAGVTRSLLRRTGGEVVCRLAEEETVQLARERRITRSEAAVLRAVDDNIGIVAVGNAPTALLKTMELIDAGRLSPALVIGVPVGFVNAAESKEMLVAGTYPHITCLGRKGGTPVAVAAVNALLRLANP